VYDVILKSKGAGYAQVIKKKIKFSLKHHPVSLLAGF
jgi:hypothetical protein